MAAASLRPAGELHRYESVEPHMGTLVRITVYAPDEEHIKLYIDMVKDGRAEEYIDRFIREPKDHMEYLERVGGMARMKELEKAITDN